MAAREDAVIDARRSYFFVGMATLMLAVAVGGFAPTYWLQLAPGTFMGPPLIHLHAALFTAWTLLLISQTWLAARGRLQHHRAWGLVGVSLGTALILVGVATALNSLSFRLAAGDGDAARSFLIVPLSAVGLFAAFFVAAIANINRPDWHKRFMLVATASLLQAAVARIPFLIATGGGAGVRPGLTTPPPVSVTFASAVVVSVLIGIAAIYDWRTRGRPHPAYLIGIAALLGIGWVRIPLSATHGWIAFADFLSHFSG